MKLILNAHILIHFINGMPFKSLCLCQDKRLWLIMIYQNITKIHLFKVSIRWVYNAYDKIT